jgi:L-ascorbate metabolism protein UlaG (beta-lactamase superfamily)
MKITKYPQSCILINYKEKNILIDSGNMVDKEDIKRFKDIDILLLTHNHSDHTDPEAIKIIKPKLILTNQETHNLLKENDIDSEILEPNQERIIDNIKIKGIKSIHGHLPSGKPAPDVIGFLIDNVAYHPGDSLYLEDKPYADVVFVPICGTVVMDGKESIRFVEEIKPKLTIPVHYSNEKYPTGTDKFEQEIKKTNLNYKILENKETIEV